MTRFPEPVIFQERRKGITIPPPERIHVFKCSAIAKDPAFAIHQIRRLLLRSDCVQSKFELQGVFRMKVAATVAAHDLQLAIDGFNDVGG